MTDWIRVPATNLQDCVAEIFEHLGQPREAAETVAEVLVEADLMGVSTHGVSNYIELIYVPGIRSGKIAVEPEITTVHETPMSAVVDGGGGMGHVVGKRAMDLAIAKAREVGVGLVAVRNSRHYGAAGIYSRMALDHDMIGFSVTNADPLVVPLFGRDSRLGTNPIAVAVPTGDQPPFLLDMATSTTPLGRIMLHARSQEAIPQEWAADEKGQPTTDPVAAFEALRLFPLGGSSYDTGGHKGYSLAMVVDILSGLLSGGPVGAAMSGGHGGVVGGVGHFFGALRVDAFRPVADFKSGMDAFVAQLLATPAVDDQESVIYAGIKEHRARDDRKQNGIPLHPKVVAYLNTLRGELGLEGEL